METTMATESVMANSRNKRPTMPPISSSGMNTATSEMLMVSTVDPISWRAFERGLEGRHALLQIARDVLDHDDGVVHHESRRNGERHQREIVETESGQIHHAERSDQRDRNGDAGNQRGSHASQEDEHHQNHQDDRNAHALSRCRARTRGWSWSGPCMTWVLMDCGMAASNCGSAARIAIHGVDDVGAGLPENDQQHGGLAVGVAGIANILHRIDGAPDVLNAHRAARCDRRSPAARNRWL